MLGILTPATGSWGTGLGDTLGDAFGLACATTLGDEDGLGLGD